MKKWMGYLIGGLAKGLDAVLSALIRALMVLVDGVARLRKMFLPLFGCLGVGILSMPFLIFFLPVMRLSRGFWFLVFLLLFFPLLGRGFSSMLNYGRYVLCEYLYDLSDDLKSGRRQTRSFSSYGPAYRRKLWEEEQRKREANRRAQNARWEEIFRDYFQGGVYYYDFRSDSQRSASQDPFGFQNGWQQQANRQSRGSSGSDRQQAEGWSDPIASFRRQYEQSCAVLGVSTHPTPYEVKLAYRKLAKQYHPDINKDPGATMKFQEINAAYEFLTKENIDRYQRVVG